MWIESLLELQPVLFQMALRLAILVAFVGMALTAVGLPTYWVFKNLSAF